MSAHSFRINTSLSPSALDWLTSKWQELCLTLGVNSDSSSEWFARIFSHYSDSGRFYHGLKHIFDLLEKLESRQVANRTVCEIAIWFHDVIYNALNPAHNERLSADMCKEFLACHDIENHDKAVTYILATHFHTPLTEEPDELEFLDLDMSILGAEACEYDAYCASIRREYNFYTDEVYSQKRQAFLGACLDRQELFFLPHNKKAWTEQARQNMQRELTALRSN